MSRDDGFEVADVSTSLYDDPKVRELWRLLADEGLMSRAMALYEATRLASWRLGCRVSAEDACPIWMRLDPAVLAALRQAKLLDRSSRIPQKSWKGWFEVARERREKARERWRRHNDNRVKHDADTALAPRGSHADTAATVPSVPTVPPVRPSVSTGSTEASGVEAARPAAVQPLSDWFGDPVRAKPTRAAS